MTTHPELISRIMYLLRDAIAEYIIRDYAENSSTEYLQLIKETINESRSWSNGNSSKKTKYFNDDPEIFKGRLDVIAALKILRTRWYVGNKTSHENILYDDIQGLIDLRTDMAHQKEITDRGVNDAIDFACQICTVIDAKLQIKQINQLRTQFEKPKPSDDFAKPVINRIIVPPLPILEPDEPLSNSTYHDETTVQVKTVKYNGFHIQVMLSDGQTFSYPMKLTEKSQHIFIGRFPANEICIDDKKVSRFHLKVRFSSTIGVVVSDLGTTNGTEYNRDRIDTDSEREWKDGEMISLGETQLILRRSVV